MIPLHITLQNSVPKFSHSKNNVIEIKGNVIYLYVRITAGASADKILGLWSDYSSRQYLKISLKAQAVDNKANKSLLKFFAKKLNIAQSNIAIISGELSKYKKLQIIGLELSRLEKLICED